MTDPTPSPWNLAEVLAPLGLDSGEPRASLDPLDAIAPSRSHGRTTVSRRRRPKDIGTAAETAVVRAARRLGFPGAERRALHGSTDLGDVLLCPGAIVEVKGGDAARKASDGQIAAWLGETDRERLNAGAAVGLLVTQRSGIGATNADRWWAHLSLDQLASWRGLIRVPGAAGVDVAPVRLFLGDALLLLRTCGWGEPL